MLRLRDIMTRQVLTVSPELSLRDVVELLAKHKVTGMPVVAAGKVIGVITTNDLLTFLGAVKPDAAMEPQAIAVEDEREFDDDDGASYFVDLWPEDESDLAERFEREAGWSRDVFGDHVVSDAMSATLCVLGPEAPVTAAADMMRRFREQRVLVVKDGRLLGVVSASDIVRAVADGRLTARRYVFDGK